MSLPFLSILTPSLNSREDFLLTAASLPRDLPDWVEWIVMDGVSSDGTVEELNNETRLKNFRSEPDRGVYDAYNKLWRASRGKYVWFLNCGDTASSDALHIIEAIMNSDVDSGRDEKIHCFGVHMLVPNKFWDPQPEALPNGMSVPTPGVLFPRKYLELVEGLNENLKVASDYELLLKLYLKGLSFKVYKEILTAYKGGGISSEYAILGFFEECIIQLKLKSMSVDEILLRSSSYAVNVINPKKIKSKRWRLAVKLGKSFLY